MSFPDLGLSDYLLGIVRIVAAIGGAVVGWFGADPLTRLGYRLWFRSATPGVLLVVMKTGCALTLSLLIYFYLPLGGGGGLGFGPGAGGQPGKGPGIGPDKSAATDADAKSPKIEPPKSADALQSVEIEIISGKRFQDDGKDRFFIVNHQTPALSAAELDDYLRNNRDKIEVTPVLTRDSIGVGGENSPFFQLKALTRKHGVKTLTEVTR